MPKPSTIKQAGWERRFNKEFNVKSDCMGEYILIRTKGEGYGTRFSVKRLKPFISQELKREREKTLEEVMNDLPKKGGGFITFGNLKKYLNSLKQKDK